MENSLPSRSNFWKRPEGVVGSIILLVLVGGGLFALYTFLPVLVMLAENILWLSLFLLIFASLAYILLDTKMRTLIFYMYQNVMRWFTGLFIQLDPIGILKGYLSDLRKNLKTMYRQMGKLRGQMHLLHEQIHLNKKDIESNLHLVNEARETDERSVVILKSRRAGRLKDSNLKLEELHQKMELLYKVLHKMYENSSILVEDIEDQIEIKEKEREIIHAGHSAMQSAMNIISGNTDQRITFDRALDAVADDVAEKVGEMEQFMKLSENFMSSIDLQKGIFEERGLAMLEDWEKRGDSLLLGKEKEELLKESPKSDRELKIPDRHPEKNKKNDNNQYDSFFD